MYSMYFLISPSCLVRAMLATSRASRSRSSVVKAGLVGGGGGE